MNRANIIRQPWLTVVRVAWVILAAIYSLQGLLNLPGYYHQLAALNPWPNNPHWTSATFGAAVTRAGIAPQALAWIMLLPVLVEMLAFLGTGLLIFLRKSNEWPSLLVSFVLVGLCGTFAGDRISVTFLAVLPPLWRVVIREAGVLIFLAFFLFMTMFPDGRFAPSWMRWIAVSLVPWWIAIEGIGLITGQAPQVLFYFGFVLLALILIGNFYRYQRLAGPVERLQIRWFLFAISVLIIHGFVQNIVIGIFPLPAVPGPLSLMLYLFDVYLSDIAFVLIPLAIGIAIFRYHLWDIDIIVRRTLQYSLLTILLGLVYFGGITLLQEIFTATAGRQSPLAVVLTTLLVAALFNPLRRRVQNLIDRRFYRQKYDADLALTKFDSLARSQVDPQNLSTTLLAVVNESLQPQKSGLWLKDNSSKEYHP